MNLHRPNANEALQTSNRSRSIAPQSGICSRCIDGCRGNCDVFSATFRGRELLYPGPFGDVTSGADKDYPVDYSHLNIMGYALGADGVARDDGAVRFQRIQEHRAPFRRCFRSGRPHPDTGSSKSEHHSDTSGNGPRRTDDHEGGLRSRLHTRRRSIHPTG